ncbi:hypothetical protein Fcan01_11356 [Folsomia candida]|uniref:Uncharacterized protein n=1 Tax=Folsomia candida TaxID=158441 RepID=A0A226EA83_FOLCA|nr:hypothetical protein Fcan01_11356 [Folsomia candida]
MWRYLLACLETPFPPLAWDITPREHRQIPFVIGTDKITTITGQLEAKFTLKTVIIHTFGNNKAKKISIVEDEPFKRPNSTPGLPFYGRRPELVQLEESFTNCKLQSQYVYITGPPAIGKSELIYNVSLRTHDLEQFLYDFYNFSKTLIVINSRRDFEEILPDNISKEVCHLLHGHPLALHHFVSFANTRYPNWVNFNDRITQSITLYKDNPLEILESKLFPNFPAACESSVISKFSKVLSQIIPEIKYTRKVANLILLLSRSGRCGISMKILLKVQTMIGFKMDGRMLKLIEKFESQSVIMRQNGNLVVHPIFILVLEREVRERCIYLELEKVKNFDVIFEPDETRELERLGLSNILGDDRQDQEIVSSQWHWCQLLSTAKTTVKEYSIYSTLHYSAKPALAFVWLENSTLPTDLGSIEEQIVLEYILVVPCVHASNNFGMETGPKATQFVTDLQPKSMDTK